MDIGQIKGEVDTDSSSRMVEISLDATLAEAIVVMARHGVHHLVVTEGGKITGLTGYRDILEAQCRQGLRPLDAMRVADAMRKPPALLDSRGDIRQALQLMLQGDTALLIAQQGKPIGLVTESDMLRVLERVLSQQHRPNGVFRKGEEFLSDPLLQNLSQLLWSMGL